MRSPGEASPSERAFRRELTPRGRGTSRFQRNGTIRSRRRAYTLLEVAICTVIVAGLFMAALQASAVSGMNVRWQQDVTVGTALGQDLLVEILQKPYADPTSGLGSFGLEAGEAGKTRALYDDVDDYNGWDESPPTYNDGTEFSWATGYRRSVSIAWVNGNTLATQASETRVKRVVVTVSRERQVAVLTALRSYGAPPPAGATTPTIPTLVDELLKKLTLKEKDK